MSHRVAGILLRKPEPKDIESLYQQKNDPELAGFLGGFSAGYSHADIAEWIERHRSREDEVLWIIADPDEDRCLGHVGLYKIDHRVRSAEYAILLGDKSWHGRGIGKAVTRFVVDYGFSMLNLNRIALSVLASNQRARRLYAASGFQEEGALRQAQYKDDAYQDMVLMALLREEYDAQRR